MSNEFERENRYIVLKRDHLAGLDDQLQARLKPAIDEAIQIMPRLDCLVVESDWPEYEPTWAAIEARVTGKPAEKNLGEPVELPNRKLHVHQGLSHTDAKVDGWNACLDEIAELGPLYTHADPSDIRVTRQALESLKGEANDLRVQIAERNALLRDISNMLDSWRNTDDLEEIGDRVAAMISASAEPSADHSVEADKMVEGDEPVAWFTDGHLTDKSATTWDSTVADRWRAKGWPVGELFARAVLERKPS